MHIHRVACAPGLSVLFLSFLIGGSASAGEPSPAGFAGWMPRASIVADGESVSDWDANYGLADHIVLGTTIYARRYTKGDLKTKLVAAVECGQKTIVVTSAPTDPRGLASDGAIAMLWTDKGVFQRGASAKTWTPVKGGGASFGEVVFQGDILHAVLADAVVRSADGGRSWSRVAKLEGREALIGGTATEVLVRGKESIVMIDRAGTRRTGLALPERLPILATGPHLFVKARAANDLVTTRVSKDGGQTWVDTNLGNVWLNPASSDGRLFMVGTDTVWTSRDGVAWTSHAAPGADDAQLIGVCGGDLIAWSRGRAALVALSLAAIPEVVASPVGAPLASREPLLGAWQCRGDEGAMTLSFAETSRFSKVGDAHHFDDAWAFDGTYVRWSRMGLDCGEDEDDACRATGIINQTRCAVVVDLGPLGVRLRYGPACDQLSHHASCVR